jgi:AcrR family transcriptional regulator
MSKNKYPEETVNLILDVSMKLFIEKGYDNSSIQDIINQLGGLSKGAIYHHFKSKESILIGVYDRISKSIEHDMVAIRDDKKLNGMEKLQKMFASSLDSKQHIELFSVTPKLLDNPRLLAIQLKSVIEDVVPNYVEPVIEEGVKDGSICTKYPKELAQVMILLSNIWMNPLVYSMSQEEIIARINFFRDMTNKMGIPIMNDFMEERLEQMRIIVEK